MSLHVSLRVFSTPNTKINQSLIYMKCITTKLQMSTAITTFFTEDNSAENNLSKSQHVHEIATEISFYYVSSFKKISKRLDFKSNIVITNFFMLNILSFVIPKNVLYSISIKPIAAKQPLWCQIGCIRDSASQCGTKGGKFLGATILFFFNVFI